MAYKDLRGLRFGAFEVVSLEEIDKRRRCYWRVINTVSGGECRIVRSDRLSTLASARPRIDHGTDHRRSYIPEYRAWYRMRRRCNDQRDDDYYLYGARGIKVCERWQSYESFYADMGSRPSLLHSIDRIDNDGNYEPSNCRWATAKEQANNRRRPIRAKPAGTVHASI